MHEVLTAAVLRKDWGTIGLVMLALKDPEKPPAAMLEMDFVLPGSFPIPVNRGPENLLNSSHCARFSASAKGQKDHDH